MQDNSQISGTFNQSVGLTADDAEKLFQAAFAGEDVTKLTSETPAEPTPEAPVEPAKSEVADPAAPAASEDKGSAPADPNAQPDPYAWVGALGDEETKAKVAQILRERQELEHKYNSDRGRVKAASTAVQNLKAELEALRAAKEEKPQAATKPAAASVDIPDSPEWSRVKEADSELATAIEKRAQELIEARLKQLAPDFGATAEERVKAAIAPFEQERVMQQQQQELYKLQQYVPNYQQVAASPQYNEWLEYYATPEIAHLANNADTASKAITVLQAFDYYAKQRWGNPQQAAPAVAATDTTVADALAKQREDKLNKSVAPANTRQPVPAGGSGSRELKTYSDQEALFLEMFNKKR